MEDKKPCCVWLKKHKKLIIGVALTVVVAGGIILVIKNWDSVSSVLKGVKPVRIADECNADKNVVSNVIPEGFIKNMSGEKLTAKELGDKTLCSAQEINKRIVAKGLATKLPCGEYLMTEVGKPLGDNTIKTRYYGKTFRNIEWDEKVLELIFSPEELSEIAERKEYLRSLCSA